MKIFNSKTLNVNGLITAVFAVLLASGVQLPPEVSAELVMQIAAGVGVAVGGVNIILRFLTNKPIKEKLT